MVLYQKQKSDSSHGLGKGAEDSPSTPTPAIQMGALKEAPSFVLPQPGPCSHLGSDPAAGKQSSFSPSPSVALAFK